MPETPRPVAPALNPNPPFELPANRPRQYTPKVLTSAQWDLAAPAVLSAVGALGEISHSSARTHLGAVCWFLSVTPRWSGTTTPDLRSLLTLATISEAVTVSRATPGTKQSRRSCLRSVGRAIGSIPDAPGTPRGRRRRDDNFLSESAHLGLPVISLVDAWRERNPGRRVDQSLSRACQDTLDLDARTATMHNGIARSSAFVRALTEAESPAWVPDMTTRQQPAQHDARTTTDRAPSRRAVLAQARRLKAMSGAVVVPAPHIDEDIAQAISTYRPQARFAATWQINQALAERLVTGYQPDKARDSHLICSMVANFLTWVACHCQSDPTTPLTAADLTEDAIAAWIVSARLKDSSKATYRTAVRRAVRSLNPDRAPIRVAYRPGPAPYTPDEMVTWRFLAEHQKTAISKANLSFVVGLGAGAGFSAQDLRTLTRESFSEHVLEDGISVITVTTANPRRPRTVPVNHLYADLVRNALRCHESAGKPSAGPLLGEVADRWTVTRPHMRTARTATVERTVDISRLRSTWLVAAMHAAIPLSYLLHAAGLSSARALIDLLPYCPPSSPESVRSALAAVGNSQ